MLIFDLIVNALRFGVAIHRELHPQPVPVVGPMTAAEREAVLTAAAKGADAPDWRSSIIDLLKVCRIDSSRSNRNSLWNELGFAGAYGGGTYEGSATQNVLMHTEVMKLIADRQIVP